MRELLERIVSDLLARETHEISLDDVGEAIGSELVSQAEIEELLQRLESSGRRVGTVTPAIREHLKVVLDVARELGRGRGAAPNVNEVAEKSGLSAGEVRAALLYASVLSR
jgi:hypothetical protein